MQYKGVRKLQLRPIGQYNIHSGKDKFLWDNDLMMKYLLDGNYKLSTRKTNAFYGLKLNHNEYVKFDDDEIIEYTKEEINAKGEVFKYNGEEYVKLPNDYDQPGDTFVCKVLPGIFNDSIFNWVKNKKYNTLECVFVLGTFEFHCIYSENGVATVDVKYAKCDNRHKNRVTISTITINDASNIAILEAVDYWKTEFRKELDNIA